MKLVLGARGRLGTALCNGLPDAAVLAPVRATYEDWWREDASASIRDYLLTQHEAVDTIFVAAGVLDPKASAEAHHRVNFLLPTQVMRAAASLGIRVLSFGSMMEALVHERPAAGYTASKMALGEQVAAWAREGRHVLHVRLHTLYGGGPPSPFMFAGQMLDALRHRTPFRMSPGTQLREYHHLDDEVPAILWLAASTLDGLVQLDHGDPVSLAELARSTFAAFDALPLLQVGALPAPIHETPGTCAPRLAQLASYPFRDAREALAPSLRPWL